MSKIFCRIAPLFALFLAASVAKGQVATGVYPYGTYDAPGIDTINVGNLNVHLSIPVLHKAGRGLPFNANLIFDSSVYYPSSWYGSKTWAPLSNFGWGLTTGLLSGNVTYYTNTIDDTYWEPAGQGGIYVEVNCYYNQYTAWTYIDSSGVHHPFGSASTQQFSYQDVYPDGWTCPNNSYSSTSGSANDGSGYQLSVSNYTSAKITASNGLQVLNPGGNSTTTDTNGNYISSDGQGHYTDTTGKVVLTVTGTAPNPTTYTYYDTGGNPQQVTVNYVQKTVQTNFGCSGTGEFGPYQEYLVNSISYPDGSTYYISYESTPGNPSNVTGRISGIELPQGGWINYSYTGGNNGIECSDGSAAGLTRSITGSGGSAASTVAYSRTITGTFTGQTSVVDGLGNNKIYTFVAPSNGPAAQYYQTSRSIYQGAATGTPVDARNTCYNGSSSPCGATAISLPISQIDTYDTVDGLKTDGKRVYYNSSSGMVTETDIYDFGTSGSRGTLLRKESLYYGYNYPGDTTQDYVYDGSGNVAGLTVYNYDGSTPIVSSGVPQHIAPSGVRANLTSIQRYLNLSTYLTTTMTYEDTGSLLTSATPNGTTTLTYDPSFVYLTGSQLPTPSSGVLIGGSATYDTANTGLALTATDANSQVTSVSSYDSMLRPTEMDYPDGGKTTFSYSPADLSQRTYQTSSSYSDSEILYDAYGRVSRVAVADGANGSAPWYLKDICYDANGNEAFVSYPYSAASLNGSKVCSGSGDTYSYDVLGRLTGVTRADGESRSYSYWGRATKSVDENNVTRISQVDGMGRLTVVCEISSNGSMPGSGNPTSCGTDIAGTGFTTSYSYALATGTTTVTQGGQTRTFQSDWLGRPTSIQEPESGTTSFSYAYNSTGLVVTRTKPKANQTSPSVVTTTTTQYDSLGRVLSISYSDGTPTRNFAYDQANMFGGGVSAGSSKGRLSWATISLAGNWAGTAFQYDAMGRVTATDECLPSGCGNAVYDRWNYYSYDLTGNLKTSTDGAGVTTSYTVSPADEVLTMTSSLNNSTDPPNILSSVANGPDGPANFSLGNGLSGVYTYDALGRMNGGWICSGSTSPYCSGGTQVYGFTAGWNGSQMQGSCDTVLNQCAGFGYDEFNRLASRNVTAGTVQNFEWVYDRWGNRLQQKVTAGSGPQPQYAVNTGNNQIVGFTYDAAGNQTFDGTHSYTYDAEGNITQVDGGSTATYYYDAFNRRVRTAANGATTEFVFNLDGQRVSEWDASTHAELKGHYYWGAKPVAFYTTASGGGAALHFEHQDWLGTERMRTTYNGGVEGTYQSLPWGDGQSTSGSDQDAYHYATLDYDSESNTDHAQFRQYSSTEGRFLSPDPYGGSYNLANPQSFNRYEYALDNPLSNIDPSGLCDPWMDIPTADEDGGDCLVGVPGGGYDGGIGANGMTGIEATDQWISDWEPIYGFWQLNCNNISGCGAMSYTYVYEDLGYWMPIDGSSPGIGTLNSADTGGVGGAPNNVQAQIQRYHQCLDEINNTPDGKLYKLLSPLQMIPGWGLTPKESQVDNAIEVGGKFAAFGFFKSVSNSSFFARTPAGSMSGAMADTMETFAEGVAVPFVIAGTVGDIAVHVGCAIATDGN